MVIYMKHPKHGTKVAISEEEAKHDEKNGWERFKLTAATPAIAADAEAVRAVADEREEVVARYKARFGKAPHHKKSLETLKAELA